MKFVIEVREREDSGLWDWKMQPQKQSMNGKMEDHGKAEVGVAPTLAGAMETMAEVAGKIKIRSQS